MLVVDANVAFRACRREQGFEGLPQPLVAPPLMWSEARSTIHLAVWKRQLDGERGRLMLDRLEAAPVERRHPKRLGFEAWKIADQMGWARTYDAEYLALARLVGGKVVTVDRRLRQGADRTGLVISLGEALSSSP